MRVVRIVFDGLKFDVVRDSFIVVRRGYLLVKMIYVYIGFVDRAVFEGHVPSHYPVVLGSSGIGRVIESTETGSGQLSGKYVVLGPWGSGRVLVMDDDGLLGSYASVREDYVHSQIDRPRAHHVLLPFSSHAFRIAMFTVEPVLIVGCNILSTALALILEELGYSFDVLCREKSYFRRIGVKRAKTISDLGIRYETIVSLDHRVSPFTAVLSRFTPSRVIFSIFTLPSHLPLTRNYSRVTVQIVKGYENYRGSLRLARRLSRLVKIIDIDKWDDALGALPPVEKDIVFRLP